jgi:microcystin-dependent protein
MVGWANDGVPFFVVVEPGTAREEKICVKYNTSTSLIVVNPAATSVWAEDVLGRGVDNTSDQVHAAGSVIYPVFTSIEANQANELVSKYANAGSVVYQGSGTPGTFTELAIGTASHVLRVNSGLPQWGQVGSDGIAESAITTGKIADGAIMNVDINASANIGLSKLATGDLPSGIKVLSANITDSTIVLGDLAAALQAFLVPVGTIAMWGGASAPGGWLLCNGTSTSGYTTLASIVGATTPNMTGRFPLGLTGSGTGSELRGTGGNNLILEGNLPSHTHSTDHDHPSKTSAGASTGHTHGQLVGLINYAAGALEAVVTTASGVGGVNPAFSTGGNSIGHDHATDPDAFASTSGATGSGTAYFQPFLSVNYIIKHD